jgi:hypothetical protein
MAAVGTGATIVGQQEAASAQRRTISNALNYQAQLQQQRGKAADQLIGKAGPQQVAKDIGAQQSVATGAIDRSGQMLDQLASGPGTASSYAGVTTGAARDAAAAGQGEATNQGFQQSLLQGNRNLAGLAANQQLINYSGNAALQTLPQQLELAGNEGEGLRVAGGLASGLGGGMLNSAMFRAPEGYAGGGGPGVTRNAAGLPNTGSFGETPGAVPAGASQNGSAAAGGALAALADGPNGAKKPLKPKSAALADAYRKKRAQYASA